MDSIESNYSSKLHHVGGEHAKSKDFEEMANEIAKRVKEQLNAGTADKRRVESNTRRSPDGAEKAIHLTSHYCQVCSQLMVNKFSVLSCIYKSGIHDK